LGRIIVGDVLWFFVFAIIVYVLYGLIWLSVYFAGFFLWKFQGVNLSYALVFITALLFPSFYAMLSIGAKIAVVKMTWRDKFDRMLYLLKPNNLLRIYAFYPIRLSIEFGCAALASAIALALFKNRTVMFVFGVTALLIPLATFRASTFEFFLGLYRKDPLIRETFSDYFGMEVNQKPE
jgi:hypothetical protein